MTGYASEKGQGFLEYGILIAVLIAAIVTSLLAFGDQTGELTRSVVDGLRRREADQPADVEPENLDISVMVVDGDDIGMAGIQVAAFDGDGNYIGIQEETDSNGVAGFLDLDPGKYSFRADYQLKSFWSAQIDSPPTTSAKIETKEGPFIVNVTDQLGNPLDKISVGAYTASKDYAGVSATTTMGSTTLRLTEGDYYIRALYQGDLYWSDLFRFPVTDQITIKIDLVPFTVNVVDRNGNQVANVPVHVYQDDDTYIGLTGTTDSSGEVQFDLKSGKVKFRVDYLGHAYWSNTVDALPVNSLEVEVGPYTYKVNVTDNTGAGISGVPVKVYNLELDYLGTAMTDQSGVATFTLNYGDYKFMANYHNHVHWSPDINVPASPEPTINVGPRILQVSLVRNNGNPLPNTYVFIYSYQTRSYTHYIRTDLNGNAYFQLPEGRYIALGYQFYPYYYYRFSNVFRVPQTDQITIRMP